MQTRAHSTMPFIIWYRSANFLKVCYITASATMQDNRDNEKKQLKITVSLPFWILFLPNLSWVILVSLHFVLYAWSIYFALFLYYLIITELPFLPRCAPWGNAGQANKTSPRFYHVYPGQASADFPRYLISLIFPDCFVQTVLMMSSRTSS